MSFIIILALILLFMADWSLIKEIPKKWKPITAAIILMSILIWGYFKVFSPDKTSEAKLTITNSEIKAPIVNGSNNTVTITNEPPPQLDDDFKKQILKRLEDVGSKLPQEKRRSIFFITANGISSQRVSNEIRTFMESNGYKIDGTGTGSESDHTSISISLNQEFQCINVSIQI